MLPSQALLLLCHLDNDLVTIIYIYTVVHMTMHKPENLGAFCFSRYPSVALARTNKYINVKQMSVLLLVSLTSDTVRCKSSNKNKPKVNCLVVVP